MRVSVSLYLLAIFALSGSCRRTFAGDTEYFALRSSCVESDARVRHSWGVLCNSIGPCPIKTNASAKGDWPNQVIYMHDVLELLVSPSTCLNTSLVYELVHWLDDTNVTTNNWWYTWVIFQVQYYDMPRIPGTRIESPATLGRKCWAFAYLKQIWNPLKIQIQQVFANTGLSLDKFTNAYDNAVPETMTLCSRVMANCFINASFDPSRNGTCSDSVGQFFVGFQWENGIRDDLVDYAFPVYNQTVAFHANAIFAVNTALNYII